MPALHDICGLHDTAARLFKEGGQRAAEGLCRQILDIDPLRVETLELFAEILLRTQRTAEALPLLQRAAKIPTAAPRTLALLCAVSRVTGRIREARAALEEGLRRHPDFAPLVLEAALIAEAQGDTESAIEAYRRAAQGTAASAATCLKLGALLRSLRRFDEAIPVYRRALALAPDNLAAQVNLGNTLGELGQFDAAVACYQRALALAPGDVSLASGLGACLLQLGRVSEAVSLLRDTMQRAPHALAVHSQLLFALNLRTLDQKELSGEHERIRTTLGAPSGSASTLTHSVARSRRRIRIGFVSADLRRHSVSYFLEPVIERLDRVRFQVICYATGSIADEVTARLRAHADGWVECYSESDEALAARIRHDGIDVLIDLTGHAAGGRPAVFARRAAPAQIVFLGYPTATGLLNMDFRISDRFVDPPEETPARGEPPLRMQHSYFCYRPPLDAPAIADLPWLRRNAPTFGCFNTLAKISQQTLSTWAAVLRAVPKARLILKAQGLAGPEARSRLLARCATAGLEQERVEILEWCTESRSHLECYARVDVALDTFPYNGATTTCEALWMGVPVVSLSGNTHVSRMGRSILAAAGRSGWAVTDAASFVSTCESLTSDQQRLANERASMRATLTASPLMDETQYVREFEQLLLRALDYSDTWKLAGGSPR
jgi:protein O-GlcNAc transferase